MKLDLLDAMTYLQNHFGNAGELLLRNTSDGIEIRIIVFTEIEKYNSLFLAAYDEIYDSKIEFLNHKFKGAIEDIKHMIELDKEK